MRSPLTLSILLGVSALLSLHSPAGQSAADSAPPTQIIVTDQKLGTGLEIRDGVYVV